PPESVFASEAEAEAAIHAWTKEHNFNVSQSQLQRNEDGDVRYRRFACDQAGQTGMNTVLPFAQIWMPGEAETDFIWAFEKLKELMVTHGITTEIFMAQFDAAVDSSTEQEFNDRAAKLRNLSGVMADYLDRQWWPHKHKIMRYWTEKYCHFGCRDTSTVEGTHASMKRWLDNSRGDLLRVFQDLCDDAT
ncbi:hypothetical protein PHMEG_00036007, partial [Phytophthora megakarya]